MKTGTKNNHNQKRGSVLLIVMVALIILTASGVGLMTISYGVRHQAIQAKNEATAMLAAEAGYERAVFRMSQQADLLTALTEDEFEAGESVTIEKPDEEGYEGDEGEETGSFDYTISLASFVASRPVFRIRSTGHCGAFDRTVDVYVIQAVSGWDMGMCRIPSGPTSTSPVYYVSGEIIDIPIHINSYGDPYDSERDIHISGSPEFRRTVTMSESRYSAGGRTDKYYSVMDLFDGGIYFLQPSSRILDRDVLQQKVDSFKDTLQSQKPNLIITPTENDDIENALPAVQLEFAVIDGVGKVRITTDCTVRGYMRGGGSSNTYDYKIDTDYDELRFEKYYIYGYHYIPEDAEAEGKRVTLNVTDTYVTPTYDGIEGEPGGRIFVDGNVVIGGNLGLHDGNQMVKGKITIVATGNIWIADSIYVDGPHDDDGIPTEDNPNVLGLIAQGVVKVVDPGLVEELAEGECTWVRTGRRPWQGYWDCSSGLPEIDDMVYEPIGISDGSEDYDRILPRYTTVEASITVGGGGWGAENVKRCEWHSCYGGRKDHSGQDYIVIHGTLTEAVRGVVGSGSDGYVKRYYLDERLLEGILPGDIWLKGKYIPAPAGWHDYRPTP